MEVKKVPKPVIVERCRDKSHWSNILIWGQCPKCKKVLA